MDNELTDMSVEAPLTTATRGIRDWCLIDGRISWDNRERTAYVLILDRDSPRIKADFNDLCRSFGDEEPQESIEHLLFKCPVFQEWRFTTQGKRFPRDMQEEVFSKMHFLLIVYCYDSLFSMV